MVPRETEFSPAVHAERYLSLRHIKPSTAQTNAVTEFKNDGNVKDQRVRGTKGNRSMSKRGQNEGSIYKRKDGRWAAVASLGYREQHADALIAARA